MGAGYIYVITNKNKTYLFVGVTDDLVQNGCVPRNKYRRKYSVYYEEFSCLDLAFRRKVEIKKRKRQKKETSGIFFCSRKKQNKTNDTTETDIIARHIT